MRMTIPVLPLHNAVLFPGVEADITVRRPHMPEAMQYAIDHNTPLLALAGRSTGEGISLPEQFFTFGTSIQVLNFISEKAGDDYLCTTRALHRFEVQNVFSSDNILLAEGRELPPHTEANALESLQQITRILSLLKQFPKLTKETFDTRYLEKANRMADRPDEFADILAFALQIDVLEKQSLLEILTPYFRLTRLYEILDRRALTHRLDQELDKKVRASIDENQKRYYLSEKMKAIREELGESGQDELKELEERIREAGMSEEAHQKAMEELQRLKMMNLSSAEASVSRTYIQWLTDIPWRKRSRAKLDLDRAREILDRDHYALEDGKDRIIEFLAVRKLTRKHRNPILCFVGPPGVGKTSLAKAIAEATGRRFVRMSLGGVRDEAEIRGHRRTYIGAIPGRLIYLMKKAGTVNPLMLLDEIDKLSSDFRGDPSSALLEALDPEQNSHFVDHYLDVDYDLSRVFFVVTANILDTIPPALRDRLEVIRIPGYTFNEKREIAKRHLLPKKLSETGMDKFQPQLSDAAMAAIIEKYTREAGVRNLERNLERLLRKFAVDAARDTLPTPLRINPPIVQEKLGVPPFRNQIAEDRPRVGVATGLAWTPTGGDVLFIEVITMPGKERIEITGQLGDVMKESVRAALSYIRSNHTRFNVPADQLKDTDIHVHIPEGAIPKDGPSAGVTVATAIFSALTNRTVSHEIAMTGELTLRGRVLAVGGVKEKLLAAHRAGIHDIILPEDNERNLKDIPSEIKDVLHIHFVREMDDVLNIMFDLSIPPAGQPGESPDTDRTGDTSPPHIG